MSIDAVAIPGRIKLREIPDVHARNSESGNRVLRVRRWCSDSAKVHAATRGIASLALFRFVA